MTALAIGGQAAEGRAIALFAVCDFGSVTNPRELHVGADELAQGLENVWGVVNSELGGASLLVSEDDHPRKWSRMARVRDIVLVDYPADKEAPRLICVYQVDLLDAQPPLGEGKKFKFEPERMLYALQWRHKAEPADFRFVLAKDPAIWFGYVTTWLLGALNRAAPHVFEALREPASS